MAKIWIDALTPKQARLAIAFYKVLTAKGHKVIVTTREYDLTIHLFELESIRPIAVGGHGKTRSEKLFKDIERMRRLTEIIVSENPELLVAYPSPSATRVAFGLNIPIILFSDTPHAIHASRLSIPLADILVHSSFIPRSRFKPYILEEYTREITYNGVEETEWIKAFKPSTEGLEKLGLDPLEYIVVRGEEKYASYYTYDINLARLAIELSKYVKVVFIPRYREQEEEVRGNHNIVLLRPPVIDGCVLEYNSIAVITGGGTMAREAALLGVPGISLFPQQLDVDEALAKLGFPLYHLSDPRETMLFIRRIVRDPDSWRINTEKLLEKLENPSKPLLEAISILLAENRVHGS